MKKQLFYFLFITVSLVVGACMLEGPGDEESSAVTPEEDVHFDGFSDMAALRAIDSASGGRLLQDRFCEWEKPLREWGHDWQNNFVKGGRLVGFEFGTWGKTQEMWVLPDELGHLDRLVRFSIDAPDLHGWLPESIYGCRSLRVLDISSTRIRERLEISPIRRIIGHLDELYLPSGYFGPVPEWLAEMPDGAVLSMFKCHISGELPRAVADMPYMKEPGCCKYRDGIQGGEVQRVYTNLEYLIISLRCEYNYALWTGSLPGNVVRVRDSYGMHWEWTDTVFDEKTGKWKRPEDDVYSQSGCVWL